MGVRTITGKPYPSASYEMTVLYSSSTDWAFGPVFMDSDEHESYERAELFLEWVGKGVRATSGEVYDDVRQFTDNELESAYHDFLSKEKELWLAKELAEQEVCND